MSKRHSFLFFLPAFAVFLLLAGCRALPERNYLGMTREQVLDAVAETPKVDLGTYSEFHVTVPDRPNGHIANSNLWAQLFRKCGKTDGG